MHCSPDLLEYVGNISNWEDIMKDFAWVRIYNERLSITKVEEVAAYSLLDLFSDIGKIVYMMKAICQYYLKNQYKGK